MGLLDPKRKQHEETMVKPAKTQKCYASKWGKEEISEWELLGCFPVISSYVLNCNPLPHKGLSFHYFIW